MKKIYLLVIFTFILACSSKNEKYFVTTKSAINFENINYEEVLAKAKNDNKLVFVDFYSVT